jgi:cytochrome P450
MLVANEALLMHILVSKNSRYTKHHAHGILERFRETTLPSSGVDAWKEVHRLISKFGRGLPELQAILTPLLDVWVFDNFERCEQNGNGHSQNGTSNGHHSDPIPDTAETLRKLYWKVVMIMVLGDSSEEAAKEHAEAWTACMARLDSPGAFLFWFAQYTPTPLNIRYAIQTRRLRKRVRRAVDTAWESSEESQPWSFLSMLQSEPSNSSHRLSKDDTTEVLLEILFTGASSVTTTLLWLLWHLAAHPEAQKRVVDELRTVPQHDNFLANSSSLKLPFLDACIRETLRLYSPIHVGRRCVQDDHFEGIDIPAGTDIAANMWFIHRDAKNWTDPHEFRPERFLNKPNNVPFYHPFSMGLRGCPGRVVAYAMIKYVVARVLTKYELSPSPDMPEPQFDGSVVLSNTPIGVYLSAKKRGAAYK